MGLPLVALIPLISSVLGAGVGVANTIAQKKVAEANLKEQELSRDYMKSAQQTTWEREDSAVQRRAGDLARAGINPLLAGAGAGASTGSPIQITAPQRQATNYTQGYDKMAEGLALMRMTTDISKTVQEQKLLELQAQKSKAENWRYMWDNAYLEKNNVPSFTSSNPLDLFLRGSGASKSIIDNMVDKAKKAGVGDFDKVKETWKEDMNKFFESPLREDWRENLRKTLQEKF